MLKGVHMTLMIGPTVPVPVPRTILEALTSVSVDARTTGPSGFELRFTLTNRSVLQTLFLVAAGAMPKNVRVIIIATVNGLPEVLIDGVMTNHQIAPDSNGTSQLVVTGEDLRRVMDYEDLNGFPFPGVPTTAAVEAIISKYSSFGVIPFVVPTFSLDVENALQYVAHQKGTDLAYVEYLADVIGYVFYIRPGPIPGKSIAYWGPQVRLGAPQPALNINMDAHTNVESLNFSINTERRVQPVLNVQEPFTKVTFPIPLPEISVANPPLGLIPPLAKRTEPIADVSKLPPVKALLRGLGKAALSSNAVEGTGSLDVARYGRLLQARSLVGVRGAGWAFDGMYYVDTVRHQIQRGQYKQSFTLTRNGLISTVPRVLA